ncbi:alpha/beta hydrolase [Flavobacterium sp. JAS]|uniref:alpha/beta hydrolase n=1 Tax=Flavobacterium sp. JAS TaxID=2897329 RepID=UPI001E2B53B6|nr:alpha/beta fold hydrolase [Flavobacterium sp. JAS]MCD0469213.1 alpha/beta hydrolase [Flavobacterium sp. JAS]
MRYKHFTKILNFSFKKVILIFLLISFNKSISQNKSDFEKEIEHPELYNSKDIDFIDSEEDVKLGGTLIFPKTEYSKIVVITPGSGQNTRNSHYVIAEELLKKGIAVYRFDDRGVGKSGGEVNFSVDQIIRDLYYALNNIQKIDSLSKKHIGVLGHSLGGIATIDAYQEGLKMDFLILMSTPIEKFHKFNQPQYSSNANPKIKVSTKELFQNLQIPMLFIAGTNDSFFECKKTAGLLNDLNNKNIEVKTLNGLNHFLRTGTDSWKKTKEYNTLYQIDDNALDDIINWIVDYK